MAKRKKYKRTNNNLQNILIKLKIELNERHLNPGVNSGAPKGEHRELDIVILEFLSNYAVGV